MQAQKIYLSCVDTAKKSDSISFWEFEASQKLAKIFYAQKQYKIALAYYYYPKNKYRQFRSICQGGFGKYNKLMAAYDLALCYYGLNLKDTAIQLLMPFVFNTPYIISEDSIDIEAVSNFFVKTLFEVYGKAQTKKLFTTAMKQIKYTEIITSQPDSRLYVDYSFCFINSKVTLAYNTSYPFECGMRVTKAPCRRVVWKELTESPAYRILMGKHWKRNKYFTS